MTVRNSVGDIVQFVYGGDSLDPASMEGKDRPVDFDRILAHVQVIINNTMTETRSSHIDFVMLSCKRGLFVGTS